MLERQPLWPNGITIPFLGVTGDFGSGKSLFTVLIDPENTIAFDFHRGLTTYQFLGFKHVDMVSQLMAKCPSGWSAQKAYELLVHLVRQIEPGKYSVGTIDAISDIEAGITDYVRSQYKKHGFSTAEKFESMSGQFWKAVRTEEEEFLNLLSGKFSTVAWTTHLRTKYRSNRPTDDKEPMGKSTLSKYATLYLWLERSPRPDGTVPDLPSATVLKGRVVAPIREDGKLKIGKVLPDHFPEASADTIRKYIINPPDWSNLPEELRVRERELTESERLRLQAQIAEDQRIAAESQISAAEKQAMAAEAKRIAIERMRTPATAEKKEPPIQEKSDVEWLWEQADRFGIRSNVEDATRRILAKRGISPDLDIREWPTFFNDEEWQAVKNRMSEYERDLGT